MTKIIAFTNDEGITSIMVPIIEKTAYNPSEETWLPLRKGQELPEGFRYPTIEEVANKDVPNGKPYVVLDASTLPDKSKREAWVLDNGKVIIDEIRIVVDVAAKANELLKELPSETRAYHYGVISEIRAAIDDNDYEVIPHLLGKVTPRNSEEAQALQEIGEALGGLQ